MTLLQSKLDEFKRKGLRPNRDVFKAIGEKISKQLPAARSYKQVGELIGVSAQNARHETCIALGKLVWMMRRDADENGYME